MKSFKEVVQEVAQPLSQGEKNFKELHGSLTPSNVHLDPKVLGQEHVFKGTKEQVDFKHTPDSEYDKDLKSANEEYKPEGKDIDAHFKKQSRKMQDAINLHLRKGNSYWDSYRKAKVHVKEDVELDEAMKKSDVMGALKQHQSKAIETRSKQFDADVELNRASKFGTPEEKEKARKESDKISSTAHYHGVQTNRARQLVSRMKGEPGDHAKNAKVNSKLAKLVKRSIPEELDLNEKTLTPAEMKKREEIVKAMKRQGADKSLKTYAIATATAKRVAEEVEMDYEGEMAKAELNAICDKAGVLAEMMSDEMQLEAWLQSKITKAKYMIDSVYDYLMYNEKMADKEEDEMPSQSNAMASNYGSFLSRMGEEVELQEKVTASDYKVGAEKSQFGGYTPYVKHKARGTTMYSGAAQYKTAEHAMGHAHAYLKGYSEAGENGANRATRHYAEKNKEHLHKKDEK